MRKGHAAGRENGHVPCQAQSIRVAAGDFITGLMIFLAVFALAVFDARPARPQPAAAPAVVQTGQAAGLADALAPDRMRSGALLLRPAGDGAGAHYRHAARRGTDVAIRVSGAVVRTTLTQTFRNTSGRAVEGLYVFPLPEAAAVDALSLQLGDRSIEGAIRPLASPPAAGIEPVASEPQDRRLFTSTIPKIAPGSALTVRIEYQQRLRPREGVFALRVPLAAPRPAASPKVHAVRFGGKRDTVSLKVRLDAGVPLGTVASDSHAIAVERQGDDGAILALKKGAVRADRDFELTWTAKASGEPAVGLMREHTDGMDYVLTMISPPTADAGRAGAPRDVVFVVDSSGSMAGRAIIQARKSLALAIGRLKPHDRFNLITFDDRFEGLFGAGVEATPMNKEIAIHHAERLQASGGTDMIAPLSAALKDDSPDDRARVRQVVLITDGAIANERQLFSEIAVKRGRSRLFLIGIGPAPDAHLLRRAAEVGRGDFLHIPATAPTAERMQAFLARLERPVMTDIEIRWPDGARVEASRDPLPDLYAGDALVATARTAALKGPVTISGTVAGRPWTKTLDASDSGPGAGIAKLWARRKIASLEARRNPGTDLNAVDRKIEAVALSHHLTSRLTHLVAFEPDDGAPVRATALMPPTEVGASKRPTGQDGAPDRQPGRPDRRARAPETTAAIVVASRQAHERIGPGTPPEMPGLLSPRLTAIGVMALLFAAMSALTFGLWRNLGRLYTSPRASRRIG